MCSAAGHATDDAQAGLLLVDLPQEIIGGKGKGVRQRQDKAILRRGVGQIIGPTEERESFRSFFHRKMKGCQFHIPCPTPKPKGQSRTFFYFAFIANDSLALAAQETARI